MIRVALLALIVAVSALLFGLAGCSSPRISRQLGGACTSIDDCAQRCLADQSKYPGGFCTTSCTKDDDCPSDAVCAKAEGGVCLFSCRDNRDCEFLQSTWTCKDQDTQAGGHALVCIGP